MVAHPKPTAVHVREKQHRLLLPYFVFSYYFFLVLLPTEFLCAPSARRGTPMDLSHVGGLTYRREGQVSRHWYYFFLVLLPTEFLCAPSARRGTPMDLSHVGGLTYRREGQVSRRRWQSGKYSIGASMKFISLCINIPNATILLRSPLRCNAAVYPVWHNILCSIFCTILLIGLRKEY